MRTYTFNRPITLLFCLPLAVLVTMFVWGLTVEFRVSLLIMLFVTFGLLSMLVYYSVLRRLRLGAGKATWITPLDRREIPLSELRHFGIVKFRKFRFAYLSRAEQVPFTDPASPLTSDQDTFIIQYRPKAWKFIESLMKTLHPDLKPESFSRQ